MLLLFWAPSFPGTCLTSMTGVVSDCCSCFWKQIKIQSEKINVILEVQHFYFSRLMHPLLFSHFLAEVQTKIPQSNNMKYKQKRPASTYTKFSPVGSALNSHVHDWLLLISQNKRHRFQPISTDTDLCGCGINTWWLIYTVISHWMHW